MSNGKFTIPAPAVAYYDFYKTNSVRVSTDSEGPSMTRQEFAEECDINVLMARYEGHVIGGPGNLPSQQPMYVDFADMPTNLMDYMLRMDEAQRAFMSLPAAVRKEFDNSAVAFVDFAADPRNVDQMRTWGLAKPAEAPRAPQVADTAPAPKAPEEPSKPA